jgi:hypothetical protein
MYTALVSIDLHSSQCTIHKLKTDGYTVCSLRTYFLKDSFLVVL